ncbi:hypothetical protein [Lutibacter citreus]|uniref:hypothetical protein n=1 Tax=Lutibacter citreus TaxID=2138210 RepID=UPI0015CFF8B2|nr:hypothetical protein [Lutibacter citreus]
MKKTEEGLIKNSYESIIGELQTIISIGYITTVAIGMLFAYQKYHHFGINIFNYADVFDFLITPFSDFKVLTFSVVSIFICLSIIRLDIYWKKKKPESYSRLNLGWDKKDWFETYRFISYSFLLLGYLYLSSDLYGKIAKKQIEKQNLIEVKFIDGEITKGIMIGKTSEILFLKIDEKITAIPIKSVVKKIEIK